jgi:hypothetical protein
VFSSPAQIVQTHEPRIETLHENFRIWQTRRYDTEALDDLVADGRAPEAKRKVIFQTRVLVFLMENDQLDNNDEYDSEVV